VSPRLGILGGTFDPIHHGHLVAAQEVLYQLRLDRVLFMPAGDPPHKPSRPVSPAPHRVRMVELGTAGQAGFAVSRVDVDRPGPHYTVDTLQLLHQKWGPGTSLYFIEGTDSLADILTWYRPERLIELAELAVVERPGVALDLDELEQRLPGLRERIHWVRMPSLEISSTGLRARVREGRPISYLLPATVEAYVREQSLYR
jgi:nicotinate-nucleotide adenylyltransferase